MTSGPLLRRRRVLQMGAAVPAVSLLPSFVRVAGAVADPGTAIGSGAIIEADGIIGLSLSWTGDSDATAAVVRPLIASEWAEEIAVQADRGHGPEDPTGRVHGPLVLVPQATAYWVGARDGHDLRVHELAARPRSLDQLGADQTIIEPIPGLEILERSNWTDIGRLDTIDCTLGASVFGLGCRADVGLRHAIVHHTVNVNNYSESDVPDLLYGIQRYHMDTRGWDDIGYNFVIDRFGRIWQAREGDIYEPITAGHTTGLNTESVGVAVLGTFSTDAVPDAVVESLGLLLGWKLGLHGVDPLGRTFVRSAGGDYAKPGEMVDLRNISGHRDNQQTSCPGSRLYDRIDEVRTGAAELVPVFGFARPSYSLDDVRITGWVMDRFSPAEPASLEIIVDGGAPIVVTADLSVDGLAADYPDGGGDHGFDHTVPIDLDTASIVVRVAAGDGRTADLMDLTLFATFIDVEPTRFFAPGVYFLREKGLTTGTLPGLFEPMDRVTRGQMATFLHRFMDLPPSSGETPFDDLVPDAFYVEAVRWLYEAGVTTGTSPTTFSPHDFVTRGQMATFLWRVCGRIAAAEPSTFDDVAPGAFFAEAVAWLAETGITTGVSPTRFAPEDDVTRGEMATFLHRLARTPEAWTVVAPPSSVDV
jgi:N-acetylmuramoyl-L-alanine amidase-like protein/S-layer family protein